MNVRRLLLLFLCSLCGSVQALSVSEKYDRDSVKVVTGGMHIDLNYSGYATRHLSSLDGHLSMGPGASLGGFIFFDIHPYFAMQFDWILHLKTSRLQIPESPGTMVFAGSEFPLTLLAQWKFPSSHRIYFGLGPSVFFGYYASLWSKDGSHYDLYQKNNPQQEVTLNYISMGFGLTLGFEFNFGLQVNASYKMGCYNMTDANRTPVRAYPHTVMIGVGYRFGLIEKNSQRHGR